MEDYTKSAPILNGLLRSKQSLLGNDHADCIELMGLRAFVLIKIAELNEASDLLEQVAEWQKTNLDQTDPCVTATNEAISELTKSLVEL